MGDNLKKFWVLLIFFFVILGFVGYFFLRDKMISPLPVMEPAAKPKQNDILVKSVDFSKINPPFLFSAKIPKEFKAEYIAQLKAINIYNPSLSGQNNIEKSQIYITYFSASRFLTLNTVDITQQDPIEVKGRQAILYEIAKKLGVPDFAGQPEWRNFKHKAIDIRFSSENPTYFYSFASNPDLSEKFFDDFINSLLFHNENNQLP